MINNIKELIILTGGSFYLVIANVILSFLACLSQTIFAIKEIKKRKVSKYEIGYIFLMLTTFMAFGSWMGKMNGMLNVLHLMNSK